MVARSQFVRIRVPWSACQTCTQVVFLMGHVLAGLLGGARITRGPKPARLSSPLLGCCLSGGGRTPRGLRGGVNVWLVSP